MCIILSSEDVKVQETRIFVAPYTGVAGERKQILVYENMVNPKNGVSEGNKASMILPIPCKDEKSKIDIKNLSTEKNPWIKTFFKDMKKHYYGYIQANGMSMDGRSKEILKVGSYVCQVADKVDELDQISVVDIAPGVRQTLKSKYGNQKGVHFKFLSCALEEVGKPTHPIFLSFPTPESYKGLVYAPTYHIHGTGKVIEEEAGFDHVIYVIYDRLNKSYGRPKISDCKELTTLLEKVYGEFELGVTDFRDQILNRDIYTDRYANVDYIFNINKGEGELFTVQIPVQPQVQTGDEICSRNMKIFFSIFVLLTAIILFIYLYL